MRPLFCEFTLLPVRWNLSSAGWCAGTFATYQKTPHAAHGGRAGLSMQMLRTRPLTPGWQPRLERLRKVYLQTGGMH